MKLDGETLNNHGISHFSTLIPNLMFVLMRLLSFMSEKSPTLLKNPCCSLSGSFSSSTHGNIFEEKPESTAVFATAVPAGLFAPK
jgi:hypothetical protein